jgi:hypothetical protein
MEPHGSERSNMAEETGLALWGGVDLDLDPKHLRQKRCTRCGAAATIATRNLDQQERVFLCDAHRRAS